MDQLWSWGLTAGGVTAMLMIGRGIRSGWLVGILNQVGFAVYGLTGHGWGFLAGAVAFGMVYLFNWLTWRRGRRGRRVGCFCEGTAGRVHVHVDQRVPVESRGREVGGGDPLR